MNLLLLMLVAVFEIILMSGFISEATTPKRRLLASIACGAVHILPSYVWLTALNWQGWGANNNRQLLLQLIVAGIAIFVRRLRFETGSKALALLVIAAFTPFIWHVITSFSIIIYMVSDEPKIGQTAVLLCSQIIFLIAVLYYPRVSWEAEATAPEKP